MAKRAARRKLKKAKTARKSAVAKGPARTAIATEEAMAANSKPSRAFVIGDRDHGLTIVITDPVMVVHYSHDDLKNQSINAMYDQEPITSMAAVVRELVPMLRGVDLNALKDREEEIRDATHGDYPLEEEEAVFAELNYADTIGRLVANNGTVCDVDFCIALDIDPTLIVARGRLTGPGVQIQDYLRANGNYGIGQSDPVVRATPQVFQISSLSPDTLGPLSRWEDPHPSPDPSAVAARSSRRRRR